MKGYDFALVRLEESLDQQLSVLHLLERVPVPGEEVIILQHPAGIDMQLMLGKVTGVRKTRFSHDVNTLPGSSGSPVFDSHWQVLGLHRNGPDPGNEGIPLAAIYPLIIDYL